LEDDEDKYRELEDEITDSTVVGLQTAAKCSELMVLSNCLTMTADHAKNFRDSKLAIDVDVCTHHYQHDFRADTHITLCLG
jgi:hypothetical protein